MNRWLSFLFLGAALSAQAQTRVVTGKVVEVYQGDLLGLTHGLDDKVVRLAGALCPPEGHPFHKQAVEFTRRFALDQIVDVETEDRGEELTGLVRRLDGRILNHELVRLGLAWWDEKSAPHDKALPGLEDQAKRGKQGFWADPKTSRPDAREGDDGPARYKHIKDVPLRLGKIDYLPREEVFIQFLSLERDDRCPEHTRCDQPGHAEIQAALWQMGGKKIFFSLSTDPLKSVTGEGGYKLELARLNPLPPAEGKSDPQAYEALLVLSKKIQ